MTTRFGVGSFQYEFVTGWEKLPADRAHADVPALCTDSAGDVYLFCRGDNPVMVFDGAGNFLDTWGEGQFSSRVHGMFMNQGIQLYLTDDGNNSVSRCSLDGTLLQTIGPAEGRSDTGYDGEHLNTITHGGPPFNRPTNVGVAPNGDLYVSDGYGNSRVHRFSAAGDFIQSWGEPGAGTAEFHLPHGIWVHSDGRVLVADRENDRLQIFSSDGSFQAEWTDVHKPQDLFIDADNFVYVAEGRWPQGAQSPRRGLISEVEPARVSVFDLDGNLHSRFGQNDQAAPGFLLSPHDISVDNEGSIYLSCNSQTAGRVYGITGTDAVLKFARV